MTRMDTSMRRIVLVTGASRGIGAATAQQLAAPDTHVLVNYREKTKRAQTVVDAITTVGGSASAVMADLSDAAVTEMIDHIRTQFGRLDALVLNASGGLERGADSGYALRLNRDAQVRLATLSLPLIPPGGRIVFVTSHQAHFHTHGGDPLPDGYEPIAASKRIGEDALRALIPEFTARGVGFVVVSGDMIDGTIIVRLLERRDPDAVAARRTHGPLPTVDDFATGIVEAIDAHAPSGHTFYIGGDDYLATTPDIPITRSQ